MGTSQSDNGGALGASRVFVQPLVRVHFSSQCLLTTPHAVLSLQGRFKEVRVVIAGMPAAGAKSLATRFTSNVWLERQPPGAGAAETLSKSWLVRFVRFVRFQASHGFIQLHMSLHMALHMIRICTW